MSPMQDDENHLHKFIRLFNMRMSGEAAMWADETPEVATIIQAKDHSEKHVDELKTLFPARFRKSVILKVDVNKDFEFLRQQPSETLEDYYLRARRILVHICEDSELEGLPRSGISKAESQWGKIVTGKFTKGMINKWIGFQVEESEPKSLEGAYLAAKDHERKQQRYQEMMIEWEKEGFTAPQYGPPPALPVVPSVDQGTQGGPQRYQHTPNAQPVLTYALLQSRGFVQDPPSGPKGYQGNNYIPGYNRGRGYGNNQYTHAGGHYYQVIGGNVSQGTQGALKQSNLPRNVPPQNPIPQPPPVVVGPSSNGPKPIQTNPQPTSTNGHHQIQDLKKSSNGYINGSLTFFPSLTNPLCVNCGVLGHYLKACTGSTLTAWEKEYLRSVVFPKTYVTLKTAQLFKGGLDIPEQDAKDEDTRSYQLAGYPVSVESRISKLGIADSQGNFVTSRSTTYNAGEDKGEASRPYRTVRIEDILNHKRKDRTDSSGNEKPLLKKDKGKGVDRAEDEVFFATIPGPSGTKDPGKGPGDQKEGAKDKA